MGYAANVLFMLSSDHLDELAELAKSLGLSGAASDTGELLGSKGGVVPDESAIASLSEETAEVEVTVIYIHTGAGQCTCGGFIGRDAMRFCCERLNDDQTDCGVAAHGQKAPPRAGFAGVGRQQGVMLFQNTGQSNGLEGGRPKLVVVSTGIPWWLLVVAHLEVNVIGVWFDQCSLYPEFCKKVKQSERLTMTLRFVCGLPKCKLQDQALFSLMWIFFIDTV